MRSSIPFLQRYLEKLSLWIILLLLMFFGSLFLFGVIVHEVLWEQEEAMDHYILNYISTHVANGPLTRFMSEVTFFASAPFLRVAYPVIVIIFLLLKNWKRAIEISVIGLGGYLVNAFMKWVFQRPRPVDPLLDPLTNYSFPSGHAMSGIIFYGMITYLVWKSELAKGYKIIIGTILILFSFIIGCSRVYLRMHYPSDVVAGFCIGFAWLAFTIWLFEWLKKRSAEELRNEKV